MDALWLDFRFALRTLRRCPGFAVVAILVLALGIGACTAIFSVVNAVLLKPLPYAHAERMAVVWERRQQDTLNAVQASNYGVTPADYLDWRAQNHVFSSLTAHDQRSFNLDGADGAERVVGVLATADMFATYGVQPVLGRGFTRSEEDNGAHVALLAHGLWTRCFGADPQILNRTIRLDGESYQVIGVLPAGFRMFFGRSTDLYVPLYLSPQQRHDRGAHDLLPIGRLAPGVSAQQAQAELAAISKQLERQYPSSNTGHSAHLVLLPEQLTAEVRPTLLLLLGAVALVLLIACANVANLLLARASAREREIAIRRAVGASRWAILRLLLTESILLAVLGGISGVLLAQQGLGVLGSLLPRDLGRSNVPGLDHLTLDSGVLLFALVLSFVTGIVFGLAPARAYDLRAPRRFRGALATAEVGLACFLLIGSLLMIESFTRLMRVQPGFQADHRLSLAISLPSGLYRDERRKAAFYQQLEARAASLPSVLSAAVSTYVPANRGGPRYGFEIVGQPKPRTIEEHPKAFSRAIGPGFLTTMGIPVVKGRGFSARDTADAPLVILLSQSAARAFWPNQDPIGKQITMVGDGHPRTIVGIVADTKDLGLDREAYPEMFFPIAQFAEGSACLIVHTAGDPEALTNTLRREIARIDPSLAISDVRTVEQLMGESAALPRFHSFVLSTFGGLAFVLAALGLYSVMAYLVDQRRQEIGIRMALGAGQNDVVRMVIRQGLQFALAGVAIGLAAALALARTLASFLFGVTATDPATYLGVALFLLTVAAAASFIPARRAAALDPMTTLKLH